MFASTNRRRRNRTRPLPAQYAALEPKRLLAFAAPPTTTTDVPSFADATEDAIVRIDDQNRLIIRTTGETNHVWIDLNFNYIQINNRSHSSTALEIEPDRYDRIILIGDGNDTVRVTGGGLRAQLHPTRMWVSTENVGLYTEDTLPLEIFGNGFENVQVNDDAQIDFGKFVAKSTNRIRMHGSEEVDSLTMQTSNGLITRTSVTLSGEGYRLSSNYFGDLYVNGNGGRDFGLLTGTRGYQPTAVVLGSPTAGDDVYFARDNFSRITNELFDARFVDIETQRVDLLTGDDRATIRDVSLTKAYYRVDGNQLVGAFRRLINIETIRVDASETLNDFLLRPDTEKGTFSEPANVLRYEFELNNSNVDETDSNPLPADLDSDQIVPSMFAWTFVGIEEVLD